MNDMETLIMCGLILSQAGIWYKIGRMEQHLKAVNGGSLRT